MTLSGLSSQKNGSNMGYYTYYTLTMQGNDADVNAAEADLLDASRCEDGEPEYGMEELIKYGGVEAKLYDIEEYFNKVAPKHPNVLMILNGDGEESDDMWESRWKGNDFECHNAIIPPFTNPNLLTDYEKQNK